MDGKKRKQFFVNNSKRRDLSIENFFTQLRANILPGQILKIDQQKFCWSASWATSCPTSWLTSCPTSWLTSWLTSWSAANPTKNFYPQHKNRFFVLMNKPGSRSDVLS